MANVLDSETTMSVSLSSEPAPLSSEVRNTHPASPRYNPALRNYLLNRDLLSIEEAYLSSSLFENNNDPFGPTNLAAAAPPHEVMVGQKPIQYRTQTAFQELQGACVAMYAKSDGILGLYYIPGPIAGTQLATLTITLPSGSRRKYVTDATFSRKKEAREAVARLALDMGAIDFLQTGNDKKHLDGVRENQDGEAMDGAVSTLGGQVHLFDTEAVVSSPAISGIEQCCQTWRTGKVSPHWLIFTHLQSPHQYGALLQIRLTPELANPSVARVWSTAAEFSTADKAKKVVAEQAMKEGVLDFIKYGNGQATPNEGPQTTIPPLLAVGETFGNPIHIDPLVLPRPPLTIQQWVDAMPQPVPHNIKPRDGTNAIAWVNQVASQTKVPVIFARVYSANGKGVGCILRAAVPGVDERTWFVDAFFNTWQEARLAVCVEAVARGGFDDFMNETAATVKGRTKVEQRPKKKEKQAPLPAKPTSSSSQTTQFRSPSKSITLETITEECVKAGLPMPVVDVTDGANAAISTATLVINVGKDARLTYVVEGSFASYSDAVEAVVEKAAKGGLIDFLTPFVTQNVRDEGVLAPGGDNVVVNGEELKTHRRKYKSRRRKAQNDASTASSSSLQVPSVSVDNTSPPKPAMAQLPVKPSSGTTSPKAPSLPPNRPGPDKPEPAVIWPRPWDNPGPSQASSSRTRGAPLTGANATPLPSRSSNAHTSPALRELYVPQRASHRQSFPDQYPPSTHVSEPPRPRTFEYEPNVGAGYQSYGRESVDHGCNNDSPRRFKGVGYSSLPLPAARPLSPPPRWEAYTEHIPPPVDVKGKGKARADDGYYRQFDGWDAEEGEVVDRRSTYGASSYEHYGTTEGNGGWYAGRTYSDYTHANEVMHERTRKRPYSAYNEDYEMSERLSKKGRWSPSIPDLPPGTSPYAKF